MRKTIVLLLLVFTIILLSGCGVLRERLLAPPDEMVIPDGSLVAECTVGEDVYKHIYKDDGIYLYYINDVLQGDAEIDSIQEQAYLNGESMANYLTITYDPGECVISDYYDEE